MYTEFYALREKPFALSPDPRYLFLADSHREAVTGKNPRVVETFRAIRAIQDEVGERAVSTYIVSMTTEPADLLRVLQLGAETGLVALDGDPPSSRLDVVPLFETRADLEHAPEIMGALLRDADTYLYVCGLKAMEEGVVLALRDVAVSAGMAWETLGAALKRDGRLHLETY